MRRLSLFVGVVSFTVLFVVNFAFPAPNMTGLWTGAAQKTTITSCSTVNVSMNLVQCYNTGNPLVRGTFTVGGKTIPVVGRIGDYGYPNNFVLNGFEMLSTTVNMVSLYGTYVASPSPRIVVDHLTFMYQGNGTNNEQYNVFTLIKK